MAMVNLSYPKIRCSLSRWKKSRCAGKWGSDTGAEGGRVYCWRISWSNIIQEGSSWVGFLVEAVYDLLSSPANLHVLLSSVLNSWVQYWGTSETCRPYRPSLTSTCSPTCCSSCRSGWWYRQVVGSWYNCKEQKSWSYLKMLSSFRSKTSGFWLLESKNTWFLKIFSDMASTTTALQCHM